MVTPSRFWTWRTPFLRFVISCHGLGKILGHAVTKIVQVPRINSGPDLTAIGQRVEFNEGGCIFVPPYAKIAISKSAATNSEATAFCTAREVRSRASCPPFSQNLKNNDITCRFRRQNFRTRNPNLSPRSVHGCPFDCRAFTSRNPVCIRRRIGLGPKRSSVVSRLVVCMNRRKRPNIQA